MNTYSGVELDNKISEFRARKGINGPEVRHGSDVKIKVRKERRSVVEMLFDTFGRDRFNRLLIE
ncbi:MAG: hypothetical protein EOO17_03760 [Chloroflexi bacterium]|nr:MAG: hypothetical protein EOO17_03760 [Chloroflexota bacterium]